MCQIEFRYPLHYPAKPAENRRIGGGLAVFIPLTDTHSFSRERSHRVLRLAPARRSLTHPQANLFDPLAVGGCDEFVGGRML